MIQVKGLRVLKSQPKEKKKKPKVNSEVKIILAEYGIEIENVEKILVGLTRLDKEKLDLADCIVNPCLNEKITNHQVACWNLKMESQDKDKGHLKFFKCPGKDLYFKIHLFFPKKYHRCFPNKNSKYFKADEKICYFSKDTDSNEVLVRGINRFLKRILGPKAPILSLQSLKLIVD